MSRLPLTKLKMRILTPVIEKKKSFKKPKNSKSTSTSVQKTEETD